MNKQDTLNAECSMKMDYSQVNLQYLIQTRDLTRKDLQLAATILGVQDEIACMISDLSPQALTKIIQIKPPLLIPRQEAWWWSRLITALRNGRSTEIEAVIEHASMTLKK